MNTTYQEFVARQFAAIKARKLPHAVGETITFSTPYGCYPGRWTGTITKRMIDNPFGFNWWGWEHARQTGDDAHISGHYVVSVFIPIRLPDRINAEAPSLGHALKPQGGYHVEMIVTPEEVE